MRKTGTTVRASKLSSASARYSEHFFQLGPRNPELVGHHVEALTCPDHGHRVRHARRSMGEDRLPEAPPGIRDDTGLSVARQRKDLGVSVAVVDPHQITLDNLVQNSLAIAHHDQFPRG